MLHHLNFFNPAQSVCETWTLGTCHCHQHQTLNLWRHDTSLWEIWCWSRLPKPGGTMLVPMPDWSRTFEIFLNQNKRMRFAWRAIDTNAIIKSNWGFSVRAFSIRLFGFMLCSSLLPPPPHDYGNTDIHEILCHWLWSLTLLFNLLFNLLRILSQSFPTQKI